MLSLVDETGLTFFYKCFQGYWGDMLYLVLYLGSLFLLCKKKSPIMRQIFLWPFVIMLLTIFNPFLMDFVLNKLNWRDRYYRFYWLIPVEILCAYMLAVLVAKQKEKESKVIVFLLALCIAYLCGSTAIKIKPSENIYKIDNYVVEVSDLIQEDTDKENPIVLYDRELYYKIRQYDPSVIAAVNADYMYLLKDTEEPDEEIIEQYAAGEAALALLMSCNIEIDADIVNEALREKKVDYFVRNLDWYSKDYLERLDIELLGKTDGYEIYRYVHK